MLRHLGRLSLKELLGVHMLAELENFEILFELLGHLRRLQIVPVAAGRLLSLTAVIARSTSVSRLVKQHEHVIKMKASH